ncbi:MAG: hypothetical protein CMD15_05955 [Flavobacteriales bacterium]|nr:hypothetical protein [Flavobacteriales bacterium]|tara:strand:- start:29598 stop:30698 length:1101 start_codon:yes stop_codon:yes gene_type:complete
MQIIIYIILLAYSLLIIRYKIGWNLINSFKKITFTPSVSVVIALRNEEKNVNNLLKFLQAQNYCNNSIEFILVNDHSTDSTLSLLNNSKLNNLRVIDLNDNEHGKKTAIIKAVKLAKGEIILATDADCRFDMNWISSMVAYFENTEVHLVSGPVVYKKQTGIFHKLQSLEFISLVISGAGSIGINNAIFCNGANMAYRKKSFIDFNDFNESLSPSGDDVFLLHSIKSRNNKSIVFAKDNNAIVTTDGQPTLNSFVNQRKRWASKSTLYKDFATNYVSYLIFLTNLTFVFLSILSFFSWLFFMNFLLFFGIKFIVDFLLIFPALKFFKRIDLAKFILPFELLYSYYIVIIVCLSFYNPFEWKGRVYR